MVADLTQPRIAIIGAGIGGLTLAACLARRGLTADVFEQAEQFTRVGAGIMLAPNAVKVLDGIGATERLSSDAVTLTTMRSRTWDTGEPMFDLELGPEARETYGAPFLLSHRGDLHAALQQLVDPATVHLGWQLVGGRPSANGTDLHFANGQKRHYEVVVAADGLHSVVRQELFSASHTRFTGRVAYRAVYDSALMSNASLMPEVGPATKWWGPDRHIVVYYVRGGAEIYFTTSVPDSSWTTESWTAVGSIEELREEFSGFHPQVQAVLNACPSVNKWALCDRDPLPVWHVDRFVLLGDAAHPMTPFMAQGAATSMEDAAVLSRCLADDGIDDLEQAFARYEIVRRRRTAEIQAVSRSNTWLREETDPSPIYGYDAWSVSLASGDDPVGRHASNA